MLVTHHENKSPLCAFLTLLLLATIQTQQAVAKHLCWKARQSFDVPFFCTLNLAS
jgi:hypothetical protein